MRRARLEPVTPAVRRVGALARPLPLPPAKKRRRPHRLRLVVVNLRPRRRRDVVVKPSLRLVRGGARAIMPLQRQALRPKRVPPARPSRIGQLVFVVAMAAVGLAALATSVGQILARAM